MTRTEEKEILNNIYNSSIDLIEYNDMKFKDAIDEFRTIIMSEKRNETLKWYDGKLPVIKRELGDHYINDINAQVIADFTIYLQNRKTKPGERTINYYRNIVVRIIKRITGRRINLDKLKEVKPKIEVISDLNINKIFNYYQNNIKAYNNLKYYLITRLLYDTGVRLNELINIKYGNVDLKSRSIYLENSKTGEPRYVFFSETTLHLLEQYTNNKLVINEYILPGENGVGHINGVTIYRAYRRLQKRLGIKQSISPHKHRHGFAQRFLARGGNIATLQKYLGHSDLRTTEIYLRFNLEYLKDQYEKIMGARG